LLEARDSDHAIASRNIDNVLIFDAIIDLVRSYLIEARVLTCTDAIPWPGDVLVDLLVTTSSR